MLTIYRRHLKCCHQTSVAYRRCKCPIHVRGTLNGQRIKRQSLDLVNWEKAQRESPPMGRHRATSTVNPFPI